MIISPALPIHHFITSKVRRPQCALDVVARPRLLKRLEQLADLTLVVAPAGYGKTTLVCTWLGERRHPAAWVTLDAEDNDVLRFLTYLVMAVREIFPDFGAELLEQVSIHKLPPVPVVGEMLSNAFDEIDQEFVLALDDYHVIRNAEIHALLTELLRLPPAPLRLVIAARHDPPLPLASLRAKSQMVEIRSKDLSFTETEAWQLLEDSLSEPLDKREIDELVRGTEGWVASLQLARLYFRQEQGFASLARALDVGARHAMDFLAEEVFTQLPQHIQGFLAQTAILDQLCACACAAVGDIWITEANAQTTLEWLENNGIFTLALDDTREWFRYHALFQQFIMQQMRRRYPAERIAGFHRRASMWCLTEGLVAEAIQHALAAGDDAGALQIFAQVRQNLMNDEDWPQLAQLFRLFPQELVRRQPELLVAQAWVAQSQYDKAKVKGCLKQAMEALAALTKQPFSSSSLDRDTVTRLEGELEILQTYVCYWNGDMAGVCTHGEHALELTPDDSWAIRILAIMFLGGAYQSRGDLAGAYALYDGSAETLREAGRFAQVRLLSTRAFLPSIAGDLSGLAENADQVLALGRGLPWRDRTALVYYFRATVDYCRNELAAVEALMAELLPRRYQSIGQVFVQSMVILALTYQAQRRPADANEITASTLTYAEQIGSADMIQWMHGLQAELALRQGRLNDADFLLHELTSAPLTPMPFFYTPHMTLLRLYLRQDTPESLAAASDLLDKLQHFLESTHNVRLLMEVFALKALYWQARGEKAAAQETLACAIRLAEPGGYVRIFADLGDPLDGLLAELQQQGVAPLLIATIRAAIESEASVETSSVSPGNDAPPVSDNLAVLLTFREQEVLQLMGEHLTNQEIAATLFISTETVKRHCISIFRKLQVKNRRAAAVYASQLSRS